MLPYSSSIPAIAPEKAAECRQVGRAVRKLLAENIRPRDILTKAAFRNAAATIAAIGGSTNGILHLLALAREAEVEFGLKDIQNIVRETPVYCNFAPRGDQTMVDLHYLGGTPLLLKHLLKAGLLDGSTLSVTGQTLAENLKDVPDVPDDQKLMAPIEAPFKLHADMQICFGNLAPEGIVFKVSSLEATSFRGPAVCFDDARKICEAVEQRQIAPGSVIVLRYLGPAAAGMPEVLIATAALCVPELNGKVAFLSDTRVSGVSHGAIGVHCSPEAAVGGPIALVQDGDEISFDLLRGDITLHVEDDELLRRQAAWKPPVPRFRRGYLADFTATVAQAHDGCVSRAYHSQGPLEAAETSSQSQSIRG
jgi:dihydroxy-acid dehydratase